jgi:hypothetical protein
MTDPASIRYKNPGAMWPGARATKWGSTHYETLNDGQGNKIAVFPTFVQGAAAQFDLWASNYTGMTLRAAIDKWSGHNSPTSYVSFLEQNTGISINATVTRELLASPAGWKLLKAQSRWEAGKPIPMTDAEWQEAQALVFGHAAAKPAAPSPNPIPSPPPKPAAAAPAIPKTAPAKKAAAGAGIGAVAFAVWQWGADHPALVAGVIVGATALTILIVKKGRS